MNYIFPIAFFGLFVPLFSWRDELFPWGLRFQHGISGYLFSRIQLKCPLKLFVSFLPSAGLREAEEMGFWSVGCSSKDSMCWTPESRAEVLLAKENMVLYTEHGLWSERNWIWILPLPLQPSESPFSQYLLKWEKWHLLFGVAVKTKSNHFLS